jgi:hypothetical protein
LAEASLVYNEVPAINITPLFERGKKRALRRRAWRRWPEIGDAVDASGLLRGGSVSPKRGDGA